MVAEDVSGGSVTVTATLDLPAKSVVTVTLAAGSGTEATASDDYTLPGAFTIAVGDSSATATVTIRDDDVAEDDEDLVLTATVSGLTVTDAKVTITDDDTAGFVSSATTVTVNVAGTAEYTVKLGSRPTDTVTVTPVSAAGATATVETGNDNNLLTFITDNWDMMQAVTVTGVKAGSTSVTYASTSVDDAQYQIASDGPEVTVTPSPGVVFSDTAVTAAGTGTVAYTVKLATEPSGLVTVTPTSRGEGVATVLPASLSFTASNWDTTQTFTVTGVTTGTTSVTHTSTSTDANYQIEEAGSVGVVVVGHGAGAVVQAHDFDGKGGSVAVNELAPDYSSVGGVGAGDWLRFDDVDLRGRPDVVMFFLGAGAGDVGDRVEVRLGSVSGPKVAELVIADTGGVEVFSEQYADVSGASGIHDVFLVFPGSSGANIDWFVFSKNPDGDTDADRVRRIQWWRDARFGQFIHWGPYSHLAGTYNGRTPSGVGEWIMHWLGIPPADYETAAAVPFNPTSLDADVWAKGAKDAGHKYVVITTKHHDGFSMFDTNVRGFETQSPSISPAKDYDIYDISGFGRDPIAELAEAYRAQGLRFGLYYSQWDWHFTNDAAGYFPAMKSQLREIVEKYDPALLWFDGEWNAFWTRPLGEALYKYMRVLKPDLVINDRVVKKQFLSHGDGDYDTTAERRGPDNDSVVDWENSQTMNDTWGYKTNDNNWKSTSRLLDELVGVTSNNGNYLLNIGPDGAGVIPAASVTRLAAIGDWLDDHGEAIYSTDKPNPLKTPKPSWGWYTVKGSTVYALVKNWPTDNQLVLSNLDAEVTKVSLLSSPETTYQTSVSSGVVTVTGLPTTAPNTHISVLKVDIDGKIAAAGVSVQRNLALNRPVTPSNVFRNDATYNGAKAVDEDDATRWAIDDGLFTATLIVDLDGARTFDRIVIKEPSETIFQRVTSFTLEYWNGTTWVNFHNGTSIGTNREVPFPAVTATRVRLSVTGTSREPTIAEFQVFEAENNNVASETNAAPVFASLSAVEVAENTTAVLTVSAADSDASDTVTGYTITGGPDAGVFEITSPGGVLTFAAAPDFEDPIDVKNTEPASGAADNVYLVEVTAISGTSTRALTAAQTIAVTVTDANEDGAATFDSSAPRANVALTAVLTEPDAGVSGVVWTWTRLDSADAASGTAVSGAVSAGQASAYTPTAADVGKWLRATASYTDAHAATETAAAVTATATAAPKVSLVLGSERINESGAGNTTTLKAALPFALASPTTLTVTAAPSNVVSLSATVLTIPANSTNSNTVTITATDNNVDGALFAVATLTATVDNAAVAAPAAVRVTVIDEDSSPQFASVSVARSVAENAAADAEVGAVLPAATDADSDDATLTYTMTGADAASFDFNTSTRQITVKSGTTLDYEAAKNTYTVTVTASDGFNEATLTVNISVTDINEAPTITSPATATVAENTTTVLTVAATDPDTIRNLSLNRPAQASDVYKNMASFDGSKAVDSDDNTRWATGAGVRRATLTVTLDGAQTFDRIIIKEPSSFPRVRNFTLQRETPGGTWANFHTGTRIGTNLTINLPAAVTANKVRLNITNAVGDPTISEFQIWHRGDNITGYAITGGADQEAFEITSPGGALTFKEAPDFENPTDKESTTPTNAAANNAYIVEITATAGTSTRALTTTQTITATVTDIPDAGLVFSDTSVTAAGTGTVTYTVKLATAPTDAVTVTPSSGDEDVATVAPASRAFTTDNWNTPQTFTVSGVATGATSITHTAASTNDPNYQIEAAGSVGVTVDPAPGLVFGDTAVTAVGTGTVTYTVRLATQPSDAVTVTPSSDDAGVATVAPATRAFTTDNWSTPQTFTVTGVATGATSVTHAATSTNDAVYRIVAAGSVGVNVETAPEILVDLSRVSVAATLMVTYEVRLSTAPTADVTVTAASASDPVATVSPATLSFDSGNWSSPQTFTVTGVATGTTSVTHTSASADSDYAITTASASVDVTVTPAPPDALTLSTDASAGSVAEDVSGGSLTVTAKLNRAATSVVTVTLAAGAGSEATATADYTLPSSFTIAVGDTEATATVSITDDDVHEGDEDLVLTTSAISGIAVTGVTVTITDDDDPGVSLSRSSLTVTAGLTAKYTLVLDSKPSADVTVVPFSPSPGVAGVASGSSSLTFTADNWDTAQTVTVSGGNQGSATISHTATSSDSDYNTASPGTLTVGSVTVTVNASGKTVAIDSQVVVTEGSDASLTVTLGEAAPVGGVGVSVAYDYSDTASSADTGTTTGTVTVAEGETTATLSVPIFDDELVENTEGFSVTISAPPAGWSLRSGQVTAVVNITDNDAANAKIAFGSDAAATSELAVSAAEGAGSVNVPVTVSHLPQVTTTFAVEVVSTGTTAGSSDYSISASSVTFDSTSSKTQNLVVSLTDNDTIGVDVTLKLRLAAAAVPKEVFGDNYARDASGSLATLTIEDDDEAGFTTSTDTLSVTTGASVTYTVKLSSQPTHSVTVTPASAATATATVATGNGDDLLTFATGDWDTAQTVTVTGVTTGAVNVAHTSSSTDTNYAITTAAGAVAVTVTPPPGLVFSTESVAAVGTGTVTYTVELATAPAGSVTVTPKSEATGTATVATVNNDDALTFSTTDWDTGQTVTVTGVTTGTTSVTHKAESDDDSVYEIAAAGSVGVTVEAATTLTVSLAAETVGEDAGGVTVTATFSRAVTEATTVTFTAAGDSASKDADFTVPDPFTATVAAAGTVATATVTITDDEIDEDAEMFTVAASGGGIDAAAVTVTITDNDTAAVTVSETTRTVEAGAESTYEVTLATQPTSSVDVTPASVDMAVATVSGVLSFTTANYSTAQTVTVSGVKAGSTSVTHAAASSDSKYNGVTVASVAVTVNAVPGLVFSDMSVTAVGTGTVTYTVKLATAPTGAVTVTPDVDNDNLATVAPASRAFTTDNWNTPQTFTVTGVATGTTSVTHAATSDNDAAYRIAAAGSVGVTVAAETVAEPGITLSESPVVVESGAEVTYTVVLNTRPDQTVSILATSLDRDVAVLSQPRTLIFTVSNWDTPQTVTATGGDVGAATIRHQVSGGTGVEYPTTLSLDSAIVVVPKPLTGETLVSNTGQTARSTAVNLGSLNVAQQFTTGSASGGYTLTEVDLSLSASGRQRQRRMAVSLWSDSGGSPETKIRRPHFTPVR